MSTDTTAAAPPQPGATLDVLARHRFRELDGIRGIAAMMVVIFHATNTVFSIPAATGLGMVAMAIMGVCNGAIAVDLFFIMSGFFLIQMLESGHQAGFWRFYQRRLGRLVPPAVVAVTALYLYSLLGLNLAPEHAKFAAQQYSVYQARNAHVSWQELLLELLLLRCNLDPIIWTLRVELTISLLYPAIVWLHWANPRRFSRAMLLAAFLGCAILLNAHQQHGAEVFHHLYMFYAGTLARDMGPEIQRLPGWMPVLLAIAGCLGMVATGELMVTSIVGTMPGKYVANIAHPLLFDLLITASGTVLIAMMAYGIMPRARALMLAPLVQFLGRISFSVYLLHWLVLRALGQIMLTQDIPQRLGMPGALVLLIAGVVALTVPIALAFHVAVERPAVAWSRRLGGWANAT